MAKVFTFYVKIDPIFSTLWKNPPPVFHTVENPMPPPSYGRPVGPGGCLSACGGTGRLFGAGTTPSRGYPF